MWILGGRWLSQAWLARLDAGRVDRQGELQGHNPPTRRQFLTTQRRVPATPSDHIARNALPRTGIQPVGGIWPDASPGVQVRSILDGICSYPGVKSAEQHANGQVQVVLAGKDAASPSTTITMSGAAKEIRYVRGQEQGTLELKDNGDQVTVTAQPLQPPGARHKLDLGLLPALLSSLYDRLHEKP